MRDIVLVHDFGGAHKEIAARMVRGLKVFAEVVPGDLSEEKIRSINPIGLILTGDPEQSQVSKLSKLGIPILPYPSHRDDLSPVVQEFLYEKCKAKGDYTLNDYISTQIEIIRHTVEDKKVLLALSGGVDSTVCAALLAKAVPKQLTCIFVDHGFMRLGEGDMVEQVFSKQELNFIRVDAADRFLDKLKGVTDPEEKRRIIGEEFIRVFEEEAAKLGHVPFLAQGTIYPDIIESGGAYGTTVKSHHNVGGIPENLNFDQIIEPLSMLFKNEVRDIGLRLKIPAALVNRQPFPGPGLAVRVIGELTAEKLNTLRKADAIFRQEIDKLKRKPRQYFAILTDTCSVGIKGETRTYDPVIALRAVNTEDFMTATPANLSFQTLQKITERITGEIPEVSRVVYDITPKPSATVEWL